MLFTKTDKRAIFSFLIIAASNSAQHTVFASESMNHDHSQMSSQVKSHYAGQENRIIKSLSLNDIKQLNTGKGWGLAKAAELNGMPGPSHLLQMKQQIKLSDEQTASIQALYSLMKKNAVVSGKKLIALEQELNTIFANKTVTEASLDIVLTKIAKARKELRYVHMVTHLRTPAILSNEQIAQYNVLRGYSNH